MSEDYRPKLVTDPTFDFEPGIRLSEHFALTCCGIDFAIKANKPRYRLIEGDISDARRRILAFKVYLGIGHVCSFLLNEFMIDGSFTEDFAEACDTISQSLADLGAAVAANWDSEDFVPGSTLLWLERMWMSPDFAGHGYMFPLLEALIGRSSHSWTVMVLKAFPLEYEGSDTDGGRPEQRRAALMRHYERRLGMGSMAPPWGDDGWMYRRLAPGRV